MDRSLFRQLYRDDIRFFLKLIIECPEAIASDVAALTSKEMEQVASLNVPLIAEAKWGKSWYDAK